MSVEGIDPARSRVRGECVDAIGELEVSVVIPCLNEHETVGVCVQKAVGALTQSGLAGEVIVTDNGSTDGSGEIAKALGARVVGVQARGAGARIRSRPPRRY